MAKQKTKTAKKPAASARVPRKEPYTNQRLAKVQERVREQAQRIGGLARALHQAKIDSLVIDGHQMLQRGLKQIDNFIHNATRAISDAKLDRDEM